MSNEKRNLIWIKCFRIIIYSRDELYRHKFQDPLILKYAHHIIHLANTTKDNVDVIMGFYTPSDTDMRDVQNIIDTLSTNLKQALLLRGYLMKIQEDGRLDCINAPPGKRFRVEASRSFGYRIEGKTRIIVHDDSELIQLCFAEIFSSVDLKKIAERVEKRNEFSVEIADFIYNWIEFNKLYNPTNKKHSEPDKILRFVNSLQLKTIDILYNRNRQYIDSHQATPSQNAVLPTYSRGKIVYSSLLYIYKIRNDILHEGKFIKPDLKKINNFIFDIVNIDLLYKFKNLNITQFYNI